MTIKLTSNTMFLDARGSVFSLLSKQRNEVVLIKINVFNIVIYFKAKAQGIFFILLNNTELPSGKYHVVGAHSHSTVTFG